MLQWMGGSRRKVNHSRMSTQKRQKQYFDQRKRQQQQQQISGLEIYEEEIDKRNNQKEHRSLDILSLLNLSKVAQQCRSSCPDERRSSGIDSLKHDEPTIFANTVLSANSIEFDETGIDEPGNQRCSQKHIETPTKLSFDTADGHDSVSKVIGDKLSHWKSTDQQLSVIDLLGDDGLDGNPEVRPKNEDHVSFSVEGLGNVGVETPVHSPRQPGRNYSYGHSSPTKAVRGRQSSKNFSFMHDLELEMEMQDDVMMQDSNVSFSNNPYGFPSYREGAMDTLNNGLPNFDDCMQLDEDNCNTKRSFGDSDIFYGMRDSDNIWDARFRFPHSDFIEKKKHDTSWKKWPWQKDNDSVDMLRFGIEMSDITFEGLRPLKKRETKKETKRLNIIDSPAPFYRYQEPEPDDFLTSDLLGYSTARKNFTFRDITSQPDRCYFSTEGLRESLCSFSDESCSSSAVRGKMEKSPSVEKQSRRRHGNSLSRPKDFIQGKENAGIHTNMSNPSRLKTIHHSNFSFEDKLKCTNSWLPEKEFPTAKKKSPSLHGKLLNEDPFGAFTVSEMEPKFHKSKHAVPIEYSQYSSGDTFNEELTFRPPSSHMQFFDSPSVSNTVFQVTESELFEESKKERRTSDSSHIAGSDADSVHPDFVVQEVVTEDLEKRLDIEKTKLSIVEQQSHAMDYESDHSKDKSQTPEKTEKITSSSERVEVSPAKVPEISESSINLQVCQNEAEIETGGDDRELCGST